ncbi:hypothetical protein BB560_003409, partial [Smittium megazygosporum]
MENPKTSEQEELLAEYCKRKYNKDPSEISKNARKKLLKDIKWDNTREARIALRKKKKLAYKERRADRLKLLSPESNQDDDSNIILNKKQKLKDVAQQSSGINIAIDLQFEELMRDNEITSITGQITRCYSSNKSTERYVNLYISNPEKRIKERFDKRMKEHLNWDP